jgi:ABC-2 type transport system permease protein
MAIAIPALLLVLFGYALALDVDQVPLIVWDQSNTPESRALLSRFDASRYFLLQDVAADYRTIEHSLDRGENLAALIIPRTFSRDLARGNAKVQALVDGSDSNTATIALGYLAGVTGSYSEAILLEQTVHEQARPLDLRSRVWFNADLESKNYIVPGLIAVIMMVIAALLTSLTVAKEWEQGTMEQLISTPVTRAELVLGKLIPYFAIGMVDVAIAVAMGEWLFDVPLRGSVVLLFGVSAVFLTGALAMGLLISVVTKSQLVASQLAMIATFLPSFLLSGFMYAISNMPTPIQMATYAIPARYFVALLKGIYLKGVGLEVLHTQALLLVVFAVLMVALALKAFHKKMA